MSGDKYFIGDKSGCYFVTIYNHTLDRHLPAGRQFFSRKEYRDIIVDSLNYCIKKGLVVYGWVIMSNHIHLIITTKTEQENISSIIRDFKNTHRKKLQKQYKRYLKVAANA